MKQMTLVDFILSVHPLLWYGCFALLGFVIAWFR